MRTINFNLSEFIFHSLQSEDIVRVCVCVAVLVSVFQIFYTAVSFFSIKWYCVYLTFAINHRMSKEKRNYYYIDCINHLHLFVLELTCDWCESEPDQRVSSINRLEIHVQHLSVISEYALNCGFVFSHLFDNVEHIKACV